MDKKLNISIITDTMLKMGLSQADLAEKLGVSRTAVTSWLKPEKFPRPRYLLKISELLGLDFEEIVIRPPSNSPQVAFRKSGNHKITEEHIERFNYSAKLLERLVPLLPFDKLSTIPKLKDPKLSYEYFEEAASSTRKELDLHAPKIEFEQIVGIFGKYNAVLIPVLWGKKHYKNATHVYLPSSESTWIFINLDVRVFDFKFWLSHELGHAKAPQLIGQEGEDFADAFAGALLFPNDLAKHAYSEVSNASGEWGKFNAISKIATEYMISPITVYKQIESFATYSDNDSLDLGKVIYQGTTQFNKKYKLLSDALFETDSPTAEQLIGFAKDGMGSCFFDILSMYLKDQDSPSKFIANLLDVSIEDAVALNKELVGASV